MQLSFSAIPEEGISIHFQGRDSSWEGLAEIPMERMPRGDLFVERRGKTVVVQGACSAVAGLACSRCLETYSFPMEASFRHILRPLEEDSRTVRETELAPEDLEYGYYEAEVIELDRLVEEYLLLAMPMKPLCSEACKGLCPVCGTNRNETDCPCDANEGKSPFDLLKKRFQ